MSLYHSRASNYTHDDLDADVTISTNTVDIYGIVISNRDAGNAATVQITESDGTTVIMEISVASNDTFDLHQHFLADNGMIVQSAGGATGTSVFVTVFHSNTLGAA